MDQEAEFLANEILLCVVTAILGGHCVVVVSNVRKHLFHRTFHSFAVSVEACHRCRYCAVLPELLSGEVAVRTKLPRSSLHGLVLVDESKQQDMELLLVALDNAVVALYLADHRDPDNFYKDCC